MGSSIASQCVHTMCLKNSGMLRAIPKKSNVIVLLQKSGMNQAKFSLSNIARFGFLATKGFHSRQTTFWWTLQSTQLQCLSIKICYTGLEGLWEHRSRKRKKNKKIYIWCCINSILICTLTMNQESNLASMRQSIPNIL